MFPLLVSLAILVVVVLPLAYKGYHFYLEITRQPGGTAKH